MRYYTRFDTMHWPIIIVGDGAGITNLHMETGQGKRSFALDPEWKRDDARFAEARKQVLEYLDGTRRTFDLPLSPQGTDFQRRVWDELQTIPFGQVRSYKDMAIALGNPAASRAVGAANGRNPIPIIIPCHRVIGGSGSLTGFAHGIDAKARLLELEGQRQKAL